MKPCIFCGYKNDGIGTIISENCSCLCIEIRDAVLPGRCVVVPRAHKASVFELSREEWNDTKNLVDKAKAYLDEKYNPDGYNLGWNTGRIAGQEIFHAHLHIIPRHADEPLAGKGICYWIKQDANKRPS